MIRLLILDIDGCLTNGRKTYDKTGFCISKDFCDKDWTAIKRFRAAGVPVHVLTGDPWNEGILAARNIPAHFTRGVEKEDFLPELCQRYKVVPEECAYIGDDVFDVGLLGKVGYPFCPNDAYEECNISYNEDFIRLNAKGGDHCLMELFEHCREKELISVLDFDEEYERIQQLDREEKF